MNNLENDPFYKAGKIAANLIICICLGLIIGFGIVFSKYACVAIIAAISLLVMWKQHREWNP